MIKFVDLSAQYREIRADVEREFADIHAQTSYVGGPQVEAFEREFAAYLGVRRVVGVSSGTDALRLALIACGIGPGDEVITVAMTFIGTIEAIIQAGARPVFVDVELSSRNLCPEALRQYLEAGRWRSANGPKAIVPVHLYGLPAPMTEINRIASAHGLSVVEDACQAHGARVFDGDVWLKAGKLGAAGCFSFYPGKNLGAWGEAGAVATDDDTIAERVTALRDHGRISHFLHQESGYNARLDTMQAAVLRAKLTRLEDWNARRRELAAAYREFLGSCEEIELPMEPSSYEHCYHLFAIRSLHRDAIREALLRNQIGCGIHYPVPLHLQPACRDLNYRRGDFPNSECVADTVLSLPMHPHLTNLEVLRVAETVREAVKGKALFAGGPPHRDQTLPPACGD